MNVPPSHVPTDQNMIEGAVCPRLEKTNETDDSSEKTENALVCARLQLKNQLSAAGVLEDYAQENVTFNKISDKRNRWMAMFCLDEKIKNSLEESKHAFAEEEFLNIIFKILEKPEAYNESLNAPMGLMVEMKDYTASELAILKIVCSANGCPFKVV
uniref:Uncharacterized protein n=1 Tax=Panagrellus redivivus TaxID=6233 RepID=A0A7E4VVV0_PANRE